MFLKPIRKIDDSVLELARKRGCCVCGRGPSDASHIKTRGSGGPDTTWNVVSHCRRHHTEWGQFGPVRFFRFYPNMLMYLRELGWAWDGEKLWHPGLQKD